MQNETRLNAILRRDVFRRMPFVPISNHISLIVLIEQVSVKYMNPSKFVWLWHFTAESEQSGWASGKYLIFHCFLFTCAIAVLKDFVWMEIILAPFLNALIYKIIHTFISLWFSSIFFPLFLLVTESLETWLLQLRPHQRSVTCMDSGSSSSQAVTTVELRLVAPLDKMKKWLTWSLHYSSVSQYERGLIREEEWQLFLLLLCSRFSSVPLLAFLFHPDKYLLRCTHLGFLWGNLNGLSFNLDMLTWLI